MPAAAVMKTTVARPVTRTAAPVRRERFDWLEEPRRRRGGLLAVELAVRSRWLDGPEFVETRAALIDALGELVTNVALPPRELFRVGWIFVAMDESDGRKEVGRPRKVRTGSLGV